MRFYADPVALGSKRAYTPEGYLVIEDVPIARTGDQLYAPHEVGLQGDRDGVVRVSREPEEVFRPETLASWNGKDVINDHPSDGQLLTTDTWRKYTCGTMLNPRRGTGNRDDLTLVDFVVKDPKTIRDVLDGKIEVSAGYDCEYEQTGPGRGRQLNIVGNHAAFVDAGRCGIRCAVGDRLPPKFRTRSSLMALTATLDRGTTRIRSRWHRFADRLNRAISTGDEEELERLGGEAETLAGEEHFSEMSEPTEAGEEGSGGELHVHVHTGDEEEEPDDMTGMDRGRRHRGGRDAPEPGEGLDPMGGEPDGDEPATKADIAALAAMIKDLADMDDEGDDLDDEEAEGGEVADRRMQLRDRRRGARDAIRRFADEVGEIVETKHNPDSTGRNDAPGTAGSGAKGIKSEPVHKGDAPGANDRRTVGGRRRSTGDGATMDSRALQSAWDLAVSQAEILAPGVELYESGRKIAFDAAAPATVTERRICALRRRALDSALQTREGRAVLDEVTAGVTVNLRTVGCDALTPYFNAAVGIVAERNRSVTARVAATKATVDAGKNERPLSAAATPADMNRVFRERYKSTATLR